MSIWEKPCSARLGGGEVPWNIKINTDVGKAITGFRENLKVDK